VSWKRDSSRDNSQSREDALLVLAKLLRDAKKLRPSLETSIRTVVKLLIQAESERDEYKQELNTLLEEIRKNHDVKYLDYAKRKKLSEEAVRGFQHNERKEDEASSNKQPRRKRKM